MGREISGRETEGEQAVGRHSVLVRLLKRWHSLILRSESSLKGLLWKTPWRLG